MKTNINFIGPASVGYTQLIYLLSLTTVATIKIDAARQTKFNCLTINNTIKYKVFLIVIIVLVDKKKQDN